MKLVIVEPKPDISKKVSRIIKLTDPSIEIVAVVKTIAFLKAWLKTRQAPDMVLINQACLDTTSFSQQHLQAKLLFPHRKTTLTYYAFRMHTILQSWKPLALFLLTNTSSLTGGTNLSLNRPPKYELICCSA